MTAMTRRGKPTVVQVVQRAGSRFVERGVGAGSTRGLGFGAVCVCVCVFLSQEQEAGSDACELRVARKQGSTQQQW